MVVVVTTAVVVAATTSLLGCMCAGMHSCPAGQVREQRSDRFFLGDEGESDCLSLCYYSR